MQRSSRYANLPMPLPRPSGAISIEGALHMPTDTKIRLTVVQSGVGTPLDALIHVSTPAVLDGRETLAREWHPEGSGPQRASSYIVYVDLPDDSEHMLLTHSYTGAYDRVSRRVATYVRSLEPGHAPKPLYGRWSPEPPIDGNVVAPACRYHRAAAAARVSYAHDARGGGNLLHLRRLATAPRLIAAVTRLRSHADLPV